PSGLRHEQDTPLRADKGKRRTVDGEPHTVAIEGMPLKAVVVDDEQLAREELIYMLEQMPNLEVIAQAGNGLEAIGVVERVSPDVLFLDVQMPGLNGFEVAHRLIQNGGTPNIIFVTAFDKHAIEAFEVNAVDYLLKPVDAARLEQ